MNLKHILTQNKQRINIKRRTTSLCSIDNGGNLSLCIWKHKPSNILDVPSPKNIYAIATGLRNIGKRTVTLFPKLLL